LIDRARIEYAQPYRGGLPFDSEVPVGATAAACDRVGGDRSNPDDVGIEACEDSLMKRSATFEIGIAQVDR